MIMIMSIKIKSYLPILFSSPIVGLTTIILFLLSSAMLTSLAAYAQTFILPNAHSNITSTTTDLASHISQLQQRQTTNQPNLHLVKIISPIKGQEVVVGKELEIFGISADNATTSGCGVYVKVNGINPYQNVPKASPSGLRDYSKWNFALTPAYTLIKPGQNRITAKFSCINNPNLISYHSVNVTGVSSTNTIHPVTSNTIHPVTSNTIHPVTSNTIHPVTSNTIHPVTSNTIHPVTSNTIHPVTSNTIHPVTSNTIHPVTSNTIHPVTSNTIHPVTSNVDTNHNKVLSVSLHLGRNSLHPGDKQIITIAVLDKNSGSAVTGASVLGKISNPAGPIKNVEGTTDNTGKASYSWVISNEDPIGKYKITTDISASSYVKYSTSKIFKVTPIANTIPSPPTVTQYKIESNPDPINSNNVNVNDH